MKILKVLGLISIVVLVLGVVNSCAARDDAATPAVPTLPSSLSLAI